MLDIHDNKLTKSIPDSLGYLASLASLDVSSNSFTSTIPSSLGLLTNLRSLLLKNNPFLVGSVPASICSLMSKMAANNLILDLHLDPQLCLDACFYTSISSLSLIGNVTGLGSTSRICTSSPTPSPVSPEKTKTSLPLWAVASTASIVSFLFLLILGLIVYFRRYYHAKEKNNEPHTDVYFLFDCDFDTLGRDNYARIQKLYEHLLMKGLNICFDESKKENARKSVERMATIRQRIENTRVLLCFVTDSYRVHVNSQYNTNVYKDEFQDAVEIHGPQFFVPVVMEPSMRNARNWQGSLGAALGTFLYCDFCNDDDALFEGKCREIEGMIKVIIENRTGPSDAFLTHNWAVDTLGRNNHERVKSVNASLKASGLVLWFDEVSLHVPFPLLLLLLPKDHTFHNTIFLFFLLHAGTHAGQHALYDDGRDR